MNAVTEGLIQVRRYCRCGGLMARGRRIGPAVRQVVNVAICWRCGYEEPSLYGRSSHERNSGSISARAETYATGFERPARPDLGGRPW